MVKSEQNSQNRLKQLLERAEESFGGLFARWGKFQPRREFDVMISEDFHLGFVFGKLEDDFVEPSYSEHGRYVTVHEYKQFWKQCCEFVREHKKHDLFYFQE